MNVTIYPGRPSGVNFEAASVVKNIAGATVQYCDTEDPFISEGSIAVGASQTLSGTYFFVTPATALLSYTDLGPDVDSQIGTLGQRIGDEEEAREAADTALDARTDSLESSSAAQDAKTSVTVIATDDATGIQARIAAAQAAEDGHVEFRQYRYDLNATVELPSRLGASFNGAVLRPASGFSGLLLDIAKHGEPGQPEFTGQGWQHVLRDLRIEGRQLTVPSSAVADDRTAFDAIRIADVDHPHWQNVSVMYCAGVGVDVGPCVREGRFDDVKLHRCGTPTGSKAAMRLTNDAAKDQNNCLDFNGLRIVYPHYIGLDLDASGDPLVAGNRLITFNGGQIEGGGYGGSGTTMQTSTAMFPFDLVTLRNCKNILFTGGIEVGGYTAAAKALINCIGPGIGVGVGGSSNMQSLSLAGAVIFNSGAGDGILADRVDFVNVGGGCYLYAASTNSIRSTVNAYRIHIGDDNTVLGPGGTDTGLDFSANPQLGYGERRGNYLTFPVKMVASNVPNGSIFIDNADNVMKQKSLAGVVTAI